MASEEHFVIVGKRITPPPAHCPKCETQLNTVQVFECPKCGATWKEVQKP